MELGTPLYTTQAHSSMQILWLSQWGMGPFKGRWMILLLRTRNWRSSEYPVGRVHSARPAPVRLDTPAQAASALQLRQIPPRNAVLQPHLALGTLGDLAASSCALPPGPRERGEDPTTLLSHAQLLATQGSPRAAELAGQRNPSPCGGGGGGDDTRDRKHVDPAERHFRRAIGSVAEASLSGAAVYLSTGESG